MMGGKPEYPEYKEEEEEEDEIESEGEEEGEIEEENEEQPEKEEIAEVRYLTAETKEEIELLLKQIFHSENTNMHHIRALYSKIDDAKKNFMSGCTAINTKSQETEDEIKKAQIEINEHVEKHKQSFKKQIYQKTGINDGFDTFIAKRSQEKKLNLIKDPVANTLNKIKEIAEKISHKIPSEEEIGALSASRNLMDAERKKLEAFKNDKTMLKKTLQGIHTKLKLQKQQGAKYEQAEEKQTFYLCAKVAVRDLFSSEFLKNVLYCRHHNAIKFTLLYGVKGYLDLKNVFGVMLHTLSPQNHRKTFSEVSLVCAGDSKHREKMASFFNENEKKIESMFPKDRPKIRSFDIMFSGGLLLHKKGNYDLAESTNLAQSANEDLSRYFYALTTFDFINQGLRFKFECKPSELITALEQGLSNDLEKKITAITEINLLDVDWGKLNSKYAASVPMEKYPTNGNNFASFKLIIRSLEAIFAQPINPLQDLMEKDFIDNRVQKPKTQVYGNNKSSLLTVIEYLQSQRSSQNDPYVQLMTNMEKLHEFAYMNRCQSSGPIYLEEAIYGQNPAHSLLTNKNGGLATLFLQNPYEEKNKTALIALNFLLEKLFDIIKIIKDLNEDLLKNILNATYNPNGRIGKAELELLAIHEDIATTKLIAAIPRKYQGRKYVAELHKNLEDLIGSKKRTFKITFIKLLTVAEKKTIREHLNDLKKEFTLIQIKVEVLKYAFVPTVMRAENNTVFGEGAETLEKLILETPLDDVLNSIFSHIFKDVLERAWGNEEIISGNDTLKAYKKRLTGFCEKLQKKDPFASTIMEYAKSLSDSMRLINEEAFVDAVLSSNKLFGYANAEEMEQALKDTRKDLNKRYKSVLNNIQTIIVRKVKSVREFEERLPKDCARLEEDLARTIGLSVNKEDGSVHAVTKKILSLSNDLKWQRGEESYDEFLQKTIALNVLKTELILPLKKFILFPKPGCIINQFLMCLFKKPLNATSCTLFSLLDTDKPACKYVPITAYICMVMPTFEQHLKNKLEQATINKIKNIPAKIKPEIEIHRAKIRMLKLLDINTAEVTASDISTNYAGILKSNHVDDKSFDKFCKNMCINYDDRINHYEAAVGYIESFCKHRKEYFIIKSSNRENRNPSKITEPKSVQKIVLEDAKTAEAVKSINRCMINSTERVEFLLSAEYKQLSTFSYFLRAIIDLGKRLKNFETLTKSEIISFYQTASRAGEACRNLQKGTNPDEYNYLKTLHDNCQIFLTKLVETLEKQMLKIDRLPKCILSLEQKGYPLSVNLLVTKLSGSEESEIIKAILKNIKTMEENRDKSKGFYNYNEFSNTRSKPYLVMEKNKLKLDIEGIEGRIKSHELLPFLTTASTDELKDFNLFISAFVELGNKLADSSSSDDENIVEYIKQTTAGFNSIVQNKKNEYADYLWSLLATADDLFEKIATALQPEHSDEEEESEDESESEGESEEYESFNDPCGGESSDDEPPKVPARRNSQRLFSDQDQDSDSSDYDDYLSGEEFPKDFEITEGVNHLDKKY